MVVVNAADAVPRLLGSPLPVTTSPAIAAAAARFVADKRGGSGGDGSSSGGGDSVGDSVGGSGGGGEGTSASEVLSTLPEYTHLEQTEVILLRRIPTADWALAVPPSERGHVLHLHEALSPNILQDHLLPKYVVQIEAVMRRCAERRANERAARGGPHGNPHGAAVST